MGRWRGYTQPVGAANRSELGLTVRIEDGVPVGTFTFAQGPGHDIEYLVASEDGFDVGYMNRMRPRGLLVYEGTIRDDVFEGMFVLRGVVFRMPDGRPPPEFRFRLERISR